MSAAIPSYIHWLRQRVGHQKIILTYASVVPFDAQGRILLQRRADTHVWGLPGGVLEPGESLTDCARRELFEETGLSVGDLRLVGSYTDPKYDTAYPNGDLVQQCTLCFQGQISGGRLQPDPEESLALEFFAPADLPWAEMPNFYVDMLHDALQGCQATFEPPCAGPELINLIDVVRPLIGNDLYIGVASSAAVLDEAGRVLVVKRSDNGEWSLPGGYMHLGENAAYTVIREVSEETGYQIEPLELLGISAQARPWVYPNHDQTIAVIHLFRARLAGGSPQPDHLEVTGLDWITPEALLAVPTHPNLAAINRAVVAALHSPGEPFIL